MNSSCFAKKMKKKKNWPSTTSGNAQGLLFLAVHSGNTPGSGDIMEC